VTAFGDNCDSHDGNPQASGVRASEVPLLLRVPEAAQALGTSRAHLYEILRAGDLPVVRLGRAVRVPASALRDWISKNQTLWSGDPWTDA
jgi:excisionase family DNA binding protein